MQNDTNNGQTSTGNNDQNTSTTNVEKAPSEFDANIEKHLDIAIDAQDKNNAAETPKPEADKTSENKQQTDSTGGAGDDKSQQRSEATGEKKPDEVSEAARTLARAKDLTVNENGQQVVVRGGAERRFYEQRETARQERDHYKRQLEDVNTRYQQLEREHNTMKQSVESLRGVEPRALEVGAKIVTDMQRDPVGTIKKLVAEAAAQGYNVEDLGVGVDTAAIQRMIDERLPKQEERQLSDDEIIAEARKEADAFFSQYPDARPHDALLGALLRDHPGMDLHTAYFQLKGAFIEKGFDWSLPLEENLKQQSDPNNGGGQQQQTNQQQNNQQQQQPLPSGRGSDSGEFKLNSGNGVVHEDMDTSEIVRQAMREQGLKI